MWVFRSCRWWVLLPPGYHVLVLHPGLGRAPCPGQHIQSACSSPCQPAAVDECQPSSSWGFPQPALGSTRCLQSPELPPDLAGQHPCPSAACSQPASVPGLNAAL